ncbi:MAG: class II aldolase/adducin family protein [Pseudomonadota bacterium]
MSPISALPDAFLALSAACGKDPLRVQGPGGNTSIKVDRSLWIKASGTELADALDKPIFVEVDHAIAHAEAKGSGDGTCRAAIVDPTAGLRPSIETTFHALIPWRVVVHTHSVATIVHTIGPEGEKAAHEKLRGLPFVAVPYRKPGRPLTNVIAEAIDARTQIVLLGNHGLIVAGDSVEDVAELMDEVERRLEMPVIGRHAPASTEPPAGFRWLDDAALAKNARLFALATGGSYYPDHVVFLGPGLPKAPTEGAPVCLIENQGLAVRTDATDAQAAMAQCVSDVLTRLPEEWSPAAIGAEAEAELLNWDAEKYRQALAARDNEAS